MEQVKIGMQPELVRRLERLAVAATTREGRQVSVDEIVQLAVEAYLDDMEWDPVVDRLAAELVQKTQDTVGFLDKVGQKLDALHRKMGRK